jgi:putative ABC transport system permease protein
VRALHRKLLRDLVGLRGQVLTIAVVVAAGVASYVTLRSAWSSLAQSRDGYYERHRFADLFVHLRRAPEALAGRIEGLPGVAGVHSRVVVDVLLPMPDEVQPATARIVSLPPGREPPLHQLYLRAGRTPEPGRPDEVVVLEAFASARGLQTGDRLPVVLNGVRRELTIVGVALSPEFVFAVPPGDFNADPRRFAVLWMNRDALAAAFDMQGAFNDLLVRMQPGADERALADRIDELIEPYGGIGTVGRSRQLSNYALDGELSQLRAFATVVPLIFLAVAAFLLHVVLSRLVVLQRPQIAALKAIGYGDRAIAAHFLQLVMVIVLLGAAGGTALGAWLGGGMTRLYGRFFSFPELELHLSASVLAVAVLVSLAAAVIGALAGVRQVVRLPPAEAMRPPAPARYRVSLLERAGVGRMLGQGALMVTRELRRTPLRTVLSALGIACAIGILVVGRAPMDSFERLLDDVFHRQFRADLMVTFAEPMPRSAAGELGGLPGVLAAEGSRTVPVRFHAGHLRRDGVVQALPERPLLRHVIDRAGRPAAPPERGIALSRKLAEVLGLQVGDPVEVELVGDGRGRRRLVVVNALVDDAFGLQGYMRPEPLRQLVGEEPVIDSVDLVVDPAQVDEVSRRLADMPGIVRINRTQWLVDRLRGQTGESMSWITIITVAFAAAIACGVIYNNARVALSTRSRDLASLRVLGFTRREISAVLLGELAVQVIIAVPIGLWFGSRWTAAVMSTADPEMYRMPVEVTRFSYGFAVAVTAGAALISALLVRRMLDRLDLIEVLKTRE